MYNDKIILEARNLYFSYDDGNSYSLSGLDVKIPKGKKIAIIGENGSGKSTLFLCFNGVNKPCEGEILFKGKSLTYTKKELLGLRSKVGIVFQEPDDQLFSASVYQEISFGILNLGVTTEQAKTEVEKIISILDIDKFKYKPTHALSGGEKKLVSIADVLVMNPEVIFFDEPYSSLDFKHTKTVSSLIDKLFEQGITIIISTHDVDYAYSWADEIIVMHDGKVIGHDKPKVIFQDRYIVDTIGIEQPIALKIFNKLCEKGVVGDELKEPKDIPSLFEYIDNIL